MSRVNHEVARNLLVAPSSRILTMVADAVPVEAIGEAKTQSLIDTMFDIARGRQGDAQYPTMVGLAAPQIGVGKRIVLIGINAVGAGEQPELREFINPEILEMSKAVVEGREGCFSTSRVCGIVSRSKSVKVGAYNRSGSWFELVLEDFPARVAQHEVDHLNGIRFPDRIKDDAHLHWVEEDEFGDYRENWSTWQVRCARTRWEAIKRGDNEY